MTQDVVLYWGAESAPCWRVMLCLEEKGICDYQSKKITFEKGEHKSEEVLKINPRGQAPAFRHGETIVNESIGICQYLEEAFKGHGTKLMPDKFEEKAAVFQKMYESDTLYNKGMVAIGYRWYISFSNKNEEVNQDLVAAKKKILQDELKLWEGYLAKSNTARFQACFRLLVAGESCHIATKDFSMADAMFFPILALLVHNGLSLESRPNLKKYYDMVSQRDSSKKLMDIHMGTHQAYIFTDV